MPAKYFSIYSNNFSICSNNCAVWPNDSGATSQSFAKPVTTIDVPEKWLSFLAKYSGGSWNVLTELACHSNDLASYFADLPIELDAFAYHFCWFPKHSDELVSHYSGLTRGWAQPFKQS